VAATADVTPLLSLQRRYNCSFIKPGALCKIFSSWRHLVACHILHFLSLSAPCFLAGMSISQKSSELPDVPPSFRRSAEKPVGGI